ncbi:helix-turn-helix domain-containing protein [Gemella sp. 27098_8_149]|uniref:helix-turn-helix domain-containing protein n=1 Tax=Gemella sp. 27098_8_149 TaxID=3003689 RepID=UPI00345C6CFC
MFNELVAQRKLKITRISNNIGISRSTLNSLTRNDRKGIQYDTLNKLCNYFNVTLSEFFSYIPYDISFNFEIMDEKGEVIN